VPDEHVDVDQGIHHLGGEDHVSTHAARVFPALLDDPDVVDATLARVFNQGCAHPRAWLDGDDLAHLPRKRNRKSTGARADVEDRICPRGERRPYLTDLTDAEFTRLDPLLPPPKTVGAVESYCRDFGNVRHEGGRRDRCSRSI